MGPSVVETIHLASFKSFRDARLPIEAFTLLIGRNGSGKSNALDGLWALSRLAEGEDIRQALDGGPEGPAVRGGVAGCPPFGETDFTLGCEVRTGGERVRLDVTIQVEPTVQVKHERLGVWQTKGWRELLVTDPANPASGDIVARWHNSKSGPNPTVAFRATRLLTTQVKTRIPATDAAGRAVHRAAEQVVSALQSMFVLDPVPHLMRQYVPRRDVALRRNAENLSAAAARLIAEPGPRQQLRAALDELNEQDVVELEIAKSELDDVMLTLVERWGGGTHRVPARVMSDGSLRFLAILVALMSPELEDPDEALGASDEAVGLTTLVIEELENGVHASQAGNLIGLIRERVLRQRVRVLATAHSSALLDALSGEEHKGVVVCQRRTDGVSTLRRLPELRMYLAIVAGGGLGRAAVSDRLRSADTPPRSATALLNEVLGRPPT
jgi:predicted ATPase